MTGRVVRTIVSGRTIYEYVMSYALAFVFGYLLGSIPFGLLLTRLPARPDIRTIGSGNIGATNVLRTGRRWLAAATLFCDMFKGTVAVLVRNILASTRRLRPVSGLLSVTSSRCG